LKAIVPITLYSLIRCFILKGIERCVPPPLTWPPIRLVSSSKELKAHQQSTHLDLRRVSSSKELKGYQLRLCRYRWKNGFILKGIERSPGGTTTGCITKGVSSSKELKVVGGKVNTIPVIVQFHPQRNWKTCSSEESMLYNLPFHPQRNWKYRKRSLIYLWITCVGFILKGIESSLHSQWDYQ